MKKKIKSVGSLLLAMTLLLTGCGSASNNNVSDGGTAAEKESGTEGNADTPDAALNSDDMLRDENMSELRVILPGGTSSPASQALVEEKMNEIIGGYMDAKIKIEILEWGVFADQQNLMLSSGEDIALMFTFSSSRNFAASNQVKDITQLCETYAPDALNSFSKYVEACRINGKLYGLPTFHEYSKSAGLVCRTDILKELNVNPDEIKTWSDLEQVLEQVKTTYPGMNVLSPVEVGNGVLDYYNEGKFDILTDGVGVRVSDAEVVNIYNSPEFMELAQQAYDWNKKGYFMSDATTVTDTRQDLLAAGNTFGYFGQIHPGTATQELKNSGVEVTTIPVTDMVLTTSNVNFAQYMVPTACTTPEKAVKLLDIMLTNKDFASLMMYGIEGVDYVIKDAEKGIVGYPDGLDNSTVGWNNETWLAGNGALAYVWESDPADIWEQYQALNDNAALSPVYGFAFDTQNVKTEITAVANVISKYKAVICAGYSEPEEAVTQMVSELEAAGINQIISDANAQIKAWQAAKQTSE